MDRLTNTRVQRMLVVAMVLMAMGSMFVSPAAAQSGINLCNSDFSGSQLQTYMKTIISLVVYGGLIAGTIGIVVGFAAESVPGMSDYTKYKGIGLKYGWGLPIILYAMKLGGSMMGLGISCLFPV